MDRAVARRRVLGVVRKSANICSDPGRSWRATEFRDVDHPAAREERPQQSDRRRIGGAVAKIFTVRQVLKRLRSDGWYEARPAPHRQFKHPEKAGTVTVAGRLGDEVPVGTLRSIHRQAGLPWPPTKGGKEKGS